MKFTQVPSQYSKRIKEVQVTIKVWVRAKAHSHCVSCESSTLPFGFSNNELHSCRLSIAEKHGANNQQEQSNVPLTVRYEIHTSAQPIQQMNWRSKSDNQSMGTCKGTFPPHILQNQCCPSALQAMNCTPADY
jgi:hypothetical protein